MFPICDEQGRVIGFSGPHSVIRRRKNREVCQSRRETPIFTKSKIFFGLEQIAKRAIL